MCILLGGCNRPSSGCYESHDLYKNVDCDGDGICDHACSVTINDQWRWLVLSSEGCPSNWGSNSRSVSDCPQAFGGKCHFSLFLLLLAISFLGTIINSYDDAYLLF